jgi:ribosomal protein S18 acetylase RimI-like enzyme
MIREATDDAVCENCGVMDLQIRLAVPADAEIVALLGRITFTETFGHLFTEHAYELRVYLDHTFAVAKIRNSLGEPDNRYWLGHLNGLPIGYAKLKFPSPTHLLPGEEPAQLQKIYVLREFLGQSLGKILLQAVIRDAAQRRLGTLWLDVLKQNTRAIRFYEREGFVPLGDDTYTIGAQTFEFHLMALRGVTGSN